MSKNTTLLKNENTFLVSNTADSLATVVTPGQENPGFSTILVAFQRQEALADVKATGSITVTGTATNAHTLTINGTVFTFATSPVGGTQIGLGTSAANLASLILAALQASADVNVVKATYAMHPASTTRIDVTYVTGGTVGNGFTLATNEGNLTLSGATLTGGTGSFTNVTLNYEIYNPISGTWNTIPLVTNNNTAGLFFVLLGANTLPDLTYPTGSTGSKVLVPFVDLWRLTLVPASNVIPFNVGLAYYYNL